jgi:hypothetical protein
LITKIFGKLIPARIKKELICFKILATEYGQFKTMKTWECLDKYNNKIPWYTYPAIEYLNNLDFSSKVIFEFGSGNSSSYWSKKSKLVISVEHNKEWYEKVESTTNNNQRLLLCQDNIEYENSITTNGQKFDVIIIDGIRRPECSKVIAAALNKDSEEGFMVILDNSDWYKETSKFLRDELNLIEVDFHGFGPINNYTWTTSIFLSRNFKFSPINNMQPNFSIAAIHQSGEN